MKLQVTHETRYDYDPAVETAKHLLFLQPLNTDHQRLVSFNLEVNPPPAQLDHAIDVFGNQRCFFSLQTPHPQLRVTAISQVVTSTRQPPPSDISWEKTKEYFRYQSGSGYDAASEFLFVSPFVPRHADFLAYARPSFPPGAGVLACAQNLMRRIYTDFKYETASTEINTPALVALNQRKGVCQDFAHIMLACLRAMGLAARYVSGYLLTVPAPGTIKLRGSDASHAWVAVYVPDLPDGSRWCDLDPTNNRCGWHSPGEDYVTLAVGRDFSDVSPMRGVIHGGASHSLQVAVTVEPIALPESTNAVPRLDPETAPARVAQQQSQSNGQGQSQSQG